jgi:IS1 family transposase
VSNILSKEKRSQIIACLCEGNGVRATSRLCGVTKNTVSRLLVWIGEACTRYQDEALRNLPCKRIQVDEIWAFCGCKAKNVGPEHDGKGWGDIWTWTAIDPDSKLLCCWFIGTRDASAACHFMHDLRARLANRVQLTSDGLNCYLPAVADAFGSEVDYAQLVKIYGATPNTPETRYSPAQCMGARKAKVTGTPEVAHISTSHVERLNLSIRMGNRRFTRLTNAHSKKVENHEHAFALFAMHYNFCKIHASLRVTPAMQAGIADHIWSLEEVIELLDSEEAKAA